MNFLKVIYGKIFLATIIFATTLFFFFPVNINPTCKMGEICPVLTYLIHITDLNNTPEYVSINFWVIIAYLVIEYIVVSAIITLSGRGGAINFIAKK